MHMPRKRMRANLSEFVQSLRKRGIEALLIGFGSLVDVARASIPSLRGNGK